MTGGPGNARWPLHYSGRRVKNQDANARVFSESQGFGKDSAEAWEQQQRNTKPGGAGRGWGGGDGEMGGQEWGGRIVFILICHLWGNKELASRARSKSGFLVPDREA